MASEDDTSIRKVEIEEDMEGSHMDSGDYFFDRIGKSIPIVNDQSKSPPLFDLQSPPSRTLAVSELHRLIFLAHPLGFCVAKTKDVMDAAVQIEANGSSTSVQQLCIVDVPIGKVHILSLSTDSSTLAVCIAADVHFFSVDSLLNKELKPSFSCSLSESSVFVKDIQWRRRSEASYLVLSNHGKLYRGALGSPLKELMDNVDAVEWSLKGKYIVVARENILHIFSSKFKERLRISLPVKSWIGDSDDNCRVKVDSIRWVLPDSIVVGCFQQTADGREENYLLQVIRSKDCKITDASSKPSVLSFYDSFYGLIDDIVPYGSGPYLSLSYLASCGLAITANKKNTDEHIQLLQWSVEDDMSEIAIVDIDRDTWRPRIELQGNGDDNLIMGLCVDKVSLHGEVKVVVGLEHKELSPFCVLFCVTLEGKLVMFYVARTGPTIQCYTDSSSQDEEEDFLSDVPSGFGQSNRATVLEKQTLEKRTWGQLNDVSKREPNFSKVSEIPTQKDLMPFGKTEDSVSLLVTQQITRKDTISKGQDVEPLVHLKPSTADEQKVLTKLPQAIDAQQAPLFGQSSLKTGPTIQPHTDSSSQDEEEDFLSDVPSGFGQSNRATVLEKQTLEQVTSDQLNDVSKREPNFSKVSEIPTKKDLMPFGKTQDSVSLLVTQQITHKDTISKEQDVEPLVHLKPSTADEQKVLTKLPQATDAQQAQLFGQSSLKNLPLAGPNYFSKNSSKAETQKITEIRSGPASSETATSVSNLANGKDLERSIDLHNSTVAINSSGLQGAPSQSWSGAKVIFSGSSESRSPFLPSTLIQGNKSDNTHISADTGSVPVDLAGKRFYLKDTIGGSPSTNFSVRPTQIVGQKAIMKTETIDSLPSIRNAHLTSQETFALGRSANQRPYSSKDAHKVPSLLNTEPHLSRQFGNIKEMAKELDILLECIEGPGGFQDATLSHKHSVEALEERMQTLSKKCRMWKNMMDDQLGEIEHLLDKTVQVLARKIYMEGIVKQASDSCYWELWNRQKLSSELELKRRHILKLNQVLTNQLIELERHFNNLELHKFGENGGVLTGRRVSQSRHGSSRQIQSLHSLYNTTNSQLAAAEQLSESLSRQMAVLSVESPIKTRNVKKELFETIGIPYEPNFCSPDATSIGDSPSLKKNLLSPGSAATRRRQSSAMKSSDSETARRRRDSLGQSWASFEPSKTTVKRVLLQESEKTSLNKLSFMDRQHLGPSVLDSSSAVSHPTNLTSPSTFMYPSGNKGTQYVFPKQAFDSGTAPSKLLNNSLRPPMLQSDNALLPSISASQARPMTGQNLAKESSNITAHKSTGRVSSVGNSDSRLINENHSIQQSETSLLKKSSVSMELAAETPALTKKPSEILSYNMKGTVDTSSMTETLNHVPTSTKGFDTSFSLLNTADVPSHPGKVVQFNAAASKTQPSEKTPLSQAFSTSLSVSSMSLSFSSPVMTPSASIAPAASSSSSTTSLSNATPIGKPFVSSKDNIDANQKVSLTSQSSVSSVFPSGSLSFQASKSLSPLHTAAPVSESYKMELRSGTGKISPPVNPTHSPSVSESLKTEVQLPTSDTSLSIIPAPPPPTSESPKPGLQSPAEKTSPSANQTSPLTLESLKTQLQPSKDKLSSRTEVDTGKAAPLAQPEPPAFSLKLDPPVSSARTTEMVTQLESGSQSSLNMAGAAYSIPQNVQPKQPSDVQNLFGAALASDSATSGKNANLEITVTEEDEMEEEAPETSCINEISLGGIGGLGLGSNPSSTAARTNPFGVSFGSNIGTTGASSSFTMTVPSGELFRPASFNFSNFSPQPSQPSPPANLGAFSGGFGATATSQAPAPRGFGQPSQIGAGQAALGSVLGSFGQSRQIGSGFPGGFASTSSMGGLSSAATGGGFAHVAPTGGGFAGLASGGGGFANLASGGGGFAGMASTGGGFGGLGSAGGGFPAAAPGGGGGGFAGAASSGGGGFGAFNSQQQGAGGFSAFGGNAGATGKPPELFTQMRK